MTRSLSKKALFQTDFPASEFATRQRKIFDAIGNDACALIQGAGPPTRSESFRQTNEFYYLCGVETAQAWLLLDGRSRTASLFLPHHNERQERNEGPSLVAEDDALIRELTGVYTVAGIETLESALQPVAVLYTPHSPAEGAAGYRDELLAGQKLAAGDPWDGLPSREQRLIQKLSEKRPGICIKDLSPILDEMRLIKSPLELNVLRMAGELTAYGACVAMRNTTPGCYEYELSAAAQYIHRMGGARGEGYRAIVAGGRNMWRTHYGRGDCKLNAGDLVLFDYAPDYHNYTSDIGRTYPVDGTWRPWQRELCGFMTRYHQELLKRVRPGVLPAQVLDETALEMKRVIEETRFSKPIYEQAARRTLTYTGHLSHPVGMAVHDVGKYFDRPFKPGLVLAIDPQMWVPEEELYIRLEDTVAITEYGTENLTGLAPIDLDEIAAIVGSASPQTPTRVGPAVRTDSGPQ